MSCHRIVVLSGLTVPITKSMDLKTYETLDRSVQNAVRRFTWADSPEDLEGVAWEGVIRGLKVWEESRQDLGKFAFHRAKFAIINYLKSKEGQESRRNCISIGELCSMEAITSVEQRHEVRDLLDHLKTFNLKDYDFLCDYFGLDGHPELGVKGLVVKYQVTSSRISQQKTRIINYLRTIA